MRVPYMMTTLRIIAITACAWNASSVWADYVPPDQLDDLIVKSESILVVEITRAEVLTEKGRYCGVHYTATVKDDLKKRFEKSDLEFVTLDTYGLPVRRNYIVFLSSFERDQNKEFFFRKSTCEIGKHEWYFTEHQSARRIFSIDPWITSAFKGKEAMVVGEYDLSANSDAFLPRQLIPEDLREYVEATLKGSRLIFVEYIRNATKHDGGMK
jgi:hypothetical protein